MPRNALEYVKADYAVCANELSPLLEQLVNEQPVPDMVAYNNPDKDHEERIAKEVNIAAGTGVSHKTILELGELTPFTCPNCQGVLVGQHIGDSGDFVRAEKFIAKGHELAKQANRFHKLALEQEQLNKNNLNEYDT